MTPRRRDKSVLLRLSADELARLKAKAQRLGISVSDLLRLRALEAA